MADNTQNNGVNPLNRVVTQPAQQVPQQAAPQPVQSVQPVVQPQVQQPQPMQQPQPAQTATQSAPVAPQVQSPVAQPLQPAQQTHPQPTSQPIVQQPGMVQPSPQINFQLPQTQRPASEAKQPLQARPTMSAQQQIRPGQPLRPGTVPRKPPNPKKLIYGCVGCSGGAVFLFIIFVLIFVSQTTASGENQMARSLGVDTGTFINTLILLVNLLFGGLSVILFLLAIIGMFRIFMARKDDKEARKKGIVLAGMSGLVLLMMIGIWVGIYMFLTSREVRVTKVKTVIGIITEPVSTLGLTAPIQIKFDASKVPIDAKKFDILSYSWNFGDGDTSSVPVTMHTYKDKGTNSGRYDVTLLVAKRDKTSKAESVDTFTTIVTIANVKLNPTFEAIPASGQAPLKVSFDASGSTAPAGEIVSYDWDFKNNNNFSDAKGAKVEYTFSQIGTYPVNLRVTDNTGQYAVTQQVITVEAANTPVAVISIPSESGKYYTGVQYSFQGDQSTSPEGKITKYEWDFGDNSASANTRTAVHTYKNAGEYEVTLTVTDDAKLTGQVVQKIKVEKTASAPIAVISTVPAVDEKTGYITGNVPFEVKFDGSKSYSSDNSIIDYKWDFDGDGTDDAAGASATYIYKKDGLYNVMLTTIDANNQSAKTTFVVKVGAQPLTARITATPIEGVVPLAVTFDASSSSYPSGQIVSYEWDFGDGSPKRIDVSKVIYKYTKIGTFTAKVTAIASDNSRSTTQTPVNVRPVALQACFAPSTDTGTAPLTVEFDPRCSAGTIAKYSWDFGDGETSHIRKPTHTFTIPGSYTVTLEVSDNDNVLNVYTKTILVTGNL